MTAPLTPLSWAITRWQWPEQPQKMGCSVWQGCPQDAFISRESSLALLVQEFVIFFSPVTKNWKTLLNNISEHGRNKDRAQGKSSNKTRDNQSCCCSLTSLTISGSFGFPSRSHFHLPSPQQPPACQGCAQSRSPHCRGPQDLSRAAQRGKKLQRSV